MKKTVAIILAVLMLVALVACSSQESEDQDELLDSVNEVEVEAEPEDDQNKVDEDGLSSDTVDIDQEEDEGDAGSEPTDVNVFVINGPTGIGAAQMMSNAENGIGSENYHFTVVTDPTEIVSKISTGEADIAAVATNLAASLYNRTEGGVQIIAVNTYGVLNVLNYTGAEINSISDLAGRTIYTTGQGANPEYIINYILESNGLDPESDVTIEFKAEGSELVPVWGTDPDAVIIAPQPVASTIVSRYDGAVISLDLTDEWNKVASDSALMMGCVVVRTEFLEEHPDAVENFLKDYEKSIKAVTEDLETVAELCADYGLVASADLAETAIPHCNICYITGEEMKEQLTGYLEVLYEMDASSVGGAMPDDDFWYIK